MNAIHAPGLNLANEVSAVLGTSDVNVVMSAIFKVGKASGLDVETLFDAIYGAGAFEQLAADTHAAHRARAATATRLDPRAAWPTTAAA